MTLAYRAVRVHALERGGEAAWDTVYVNPVLADMLDGPAVALGVVADEPTCATPGLSAATAVYWAAVAPPALEDTADVPHGEPALFSGTLSGWACVRAVTPLPLTAAYLAVPAARFAGVREDSAALRAALLGRLLRADESFLLKGLVARVVQTEPVAQGVVDEATRLCVVADDRPSRVPGPTPESEPAPVPFTERFLERGAPVTLLARSMPSPAPALDAARRCAEYVDVESVVLVAPATLAGLTFVGDWAVASVAPDETLSADAAARPRLVRVYTAADVPTDVVLVPPMLAQNLSTGVYDPQARLFVTLEALPPHAAEEAASIADVAVAGPAAKPPLVPLAESLELARVASPITQDAAFETQCAEALRAYLAGQPRLLCAGDVLAVRVAAGRERFCSVDVERDAITAEARATGAAAQLPYAPAHAAHAAFFCVTELAPELIDPDAQLRAIPPACAALRAWHAALMGGHDVSEDAGLARAGCWVDAGHTRIVQSGVVQRRVTDVTAWLGLARDTPSCPPDGTPLTAADSAFARLAALVRAAASPAAARLGVRLGVLLDGARGIGKRTTARWVAQRLGLHMYEVRCAELTGDTDAHTEGMLRAKVDAARACAPSLLLLQDVDVLVRRGTADAAQSAVAKMLQRCLADGPSAMITCATTEDAERCSALRGCFNETVSFAPPEEPARAQLLDMALAPYVVGADVDVRALAVQTAALLAADLAELAARAARASVARVLSSGGVLGDVVAARPVLTAADLDAALGAVRASYATSIGAPRIPNVTWDDVGGLASVKDEILDTVQLPLERPELFSDGVKKRSGVLLYGPPGTGKTLLAKAVATTCALNFFSVKGPELLNMYIGESEANMRRVFQRARDAKPCVIFFDELDSIAPKRGNQGDSGGVMDRIVSQLLAELDGMSSGAAASDVFVIGATNRPDLLDPALLRPGRFDRLLYLSVAETHDAQRNILQALTRKFALAEDVGDLSVIAEQCPFNLTGADFYALCSDAMLKAMTERAAAIDATVARLEEQRTDAHAHWPHPLTPQYYLSELAQPSEVHVQVSRAHFEQALAELTPSVSPEEMAHYREVQKKFSQPDTEGADASGPRVPAGVGPPEPGDSASGSGPAKSSADAASSVPPAASASDPDATDPPPKASRKGKGRAM